jgi:hypothetical protein
LWQCHGQKGAGVPCTPQGGIGAGEPPFHQGRRSYMALSSSCLHDLGCRAPRSLPARSGHDLFRRCGLS